MNSTRPHIIPIGDMHIHCASEKCWCHPLNKDGVVVHNAKDCREARERQNVDTGKIWVEVLESYQRETKSHDVPEWSAKAAEEIEAALGNRVRENTGLQFGFFAGISVNDLAAIILRHLPNNIYSYDRRADDQEAGT